MFKEFKEFAVRGNVMDMAVGIIIGAAFGKIVNSLVNDIMMPPIGQVTGRVNFKDLSVAIGGAQTGIYPFETPGGWNLIGCTPWRLFNPHARPPALLQVGDRVRFQPITSTEYAAGRTS